jgi:hypothetical protein
MGAFSYEEFDAALDHINKMVDQLTIDRDHWKERVTKLKEEWKRIARLEGALRNATEWVELRFDGPRQRPAWAADARSALGGLVNSERKTERG